MRRLVAFAATGIACIALAFVAGAQADISPPPIPGSFVFHETDTPDGNCSDVYGLQFAPVPGATAYSYTYFDGYWNSDFDSTETSAEFLAETYSTRSLYFHGITGGTGPQPCTANGNDDGGRFSTPPTIVPEYAAGHNPPLAPARYSSKPASSGRARLQAASGTFPVSSTASIDILITSYRPLTGFKVSSLQVSDGAKVVQQPVEEEGSSVLPAHSQQTFTAQVEGTKIGRVSLRVTFTGRFKAKHAKKSQEITITASSSLKFGTS